MTLIENDSTTNRDRWADAALLAVAALLLFVGLGVRGLWASESRWAEVTREMFLSRDFFHPTIGGLPYFDKPLLTYWLVGLASLLPGGLNEWAARAPNALSGIVAVWATMRLGKRLWSAQTGRLAGWILLTTYGVMFWSRTADADIENLAAVMLCVSWYWAKRDRPGFMAFLVFYLIAFSGSLMKGLLAVVVPLCAILPDLIANRRWRTVLTPSHAAALAVGLALYVTPFAYASLAGHSTYTANGLSLVFRENVQRFFAPFDHKDPIYTYFIHLPLLFLPWAPLLMLALVSLVRRWKELDVHTRWLLWAVATIFAFFTASGSRRSYYILPALPFCALLTAVFLTHLRDARLDKARRVGLMIQEFLLGTAIAVELGGLVMLAAFGGRKGFQMPPLFYVATLVVCGCGAALWIAIRCLAARRGRPDPFTARLLAVGAVTAVLLGGWFCWQGNLIDLQRAERPFVKQLALRAAAIPTQDIGLFPGPDGALLFYLNRPSHVTLLPDDNELTAFLQRDRPRVLICRQKDVPPKLLEELDPRPCLTEAAASWESKSARNRKWRAWFLNQPLTTRVEPTPQPATHED